MNDIEHIVHTRLHTVGDDLTVTDAADHVTAAKAIHHRRRRSRVALVAVAAATVAIVGGPLAIGSLSASSPQGTQVAGPGGSNSAAEAAARRAAESQAAEARAAADDAARAAAAAAAESAAAAAALPDATRVQGEAELAAESDRAQAYGQVMHDCLARAGFGTIVSGDGYQSSAATDQRAAFAAAEDTCRQQTGYVDLPRLSDDAYRVLYADYLTVYQCVLAKGYIPSPPPSVDAFVAGGGDWYLYDGLTAGATQVSETACPMPTY